LAKRDHLTNKSPVGKRIFEPTINTFDHIIASVRWMTFLEHMRASSHP
jgi:hypothetical protein